MKTEKYRELKRLTNYYLDNNVRSNDLHIILEDLNLETVFLTTAINNKEYRNQSEENKKLIDNIVNLLIPLTYRDRKELLTRYWKEYNAERNSNTKETVARA